MCEPQSLTYEDQKYLSQDPEERCHINLLVFETKKRVELIYLTKVMSMSL
jgi:hypothetical protein